MRQDHIFHVASRTQACTAVMMMMQYVQGKKMSLDDPMPEAGADPVHLIGSAPPPQ
jgi:hypothetical protein